MPPITALLHTSNDGLRLGRTLETLLPCSEILIVDHHSADATQRIALEYGARIKIADGPAAADHYLQFVRHNWIFCIAPGESITEGLQASLFEWSAMAEGDPLRKLAKQSGSVMVREQAGKNWRELPTPETRLVPRNWTIWVGQLPACDPAAILLEGELLRFTLP